MLCPIVQGSYTISELYSQQLNYQQDKYSWTNCTGPDQASGCSKAEGITGLSEKTQKHLNPTLIHLYLCYAVL